MSVMMRMVSKKLATQHVLVVLVLHEDTESVSRPKLWARRTWMS
jgi:hypothetical protein